MQVKRIGGFQKNLKLPLWRVWQSTGLICESLKIYQLLLLMNLRHSLGRNSDVLFFQSTHRHGATEPSQVLLPVSSRCRQQDCCAEKPDRKRSEKLR